MKQRFISFLLLAGIQPTLVVPLHVWHHHDAMPHATCACDQQVDPPRYTSTQDDIHADSHSGSCTLCSAARTLVSKPQEIQGIRFDDVITLTVLCSFSVIPQNAILANGARGPPSL